MRRSSSSRAKSSGAKKSTTQKKSTSAAGKKSSGRRYSPGASDTVEKEMHKFKRGQLRTGTGKKVTNPKQAIAIGLSEARREGKKVPPPPRERKAA
jgi:hypothetical protein